MNWNNIRSINGKQFDGFEEFVCQLARKENIINAKKFVRLGNPDGGLECYWELNDGNLIGWQAKFFTNSLSSKWNQIQESIESLLNNYTNIKKYIIAIPLDPPKNGRVTVEEKIKEWEELAKSKNVDLTIEFLWSNDMIEKIQTPDYEGFRKFWFNDAEFTDLWFENQVNLSLKNLGEKYNPNLIIESENINYFDCMSRNKRFEEYFYDKVGSYIIDFQKLFDGLIKINPPCLSLTERYGVCINLFSNIYWLERLYYQNIGKIKNIFINFDFCEMNNFNFNIITNLFNEIKLELINLTEKIKKLDNLLYAQFKEYIKLKSIFRKSNQLINFINSIVYFLNKSMFNLINNPFAIFYGEAGIGKTFLFANVVDNKIKENEDVILLFGHQFNSIENPGNIIIKELGIQQHNYNFDDFLDALECKAQINKNRIIILIDAINEGKGIKLWEDYFNGFFAQISKRKWIGCAVSIRDNYLDYLDINERISKEINSLITRKKLWGFQYNLNEAVIKYFSSYNIQLPNTPILNPEFSNPLFLSIFCKSFENSGYTFIPEGWDGLSKLMDLYMSSINQKLSSKLGYSSKINLVEVVLKKLLTNYYGENLGNYKIVYDIIMKELYDYPFRFRFLDCLICEGILIKNIIRNEEFIDITYQRLKDYLFVKYTLNDIEDIDLKIEFDKNGKLYELIENSNEDLLDMLSIFIPEKYSIELYEIISSDLKGDYSIVHSFISSLKWRNKSLNERVFDYINKYVLNECLDYFLETLIILAPIENHLLNANKTHEFLFKQNLADRDACWTIFLQEEYNEDSPINFMFNFAFSENFSIYSEKSIKLSAIMIAWFLTSTNKKLRDLSTNALVNLLKNHIGILIDLLKKFENVNDAYVYERLFAVAYGCSLLTSNLNSLQDLAMYVYNTIFNKDGVYPNILLRDYARNIIEFCLIKKIKLDINVEKIRPPYISKFPEIPSREYMKKLKNNSSKNIQSKIIFHSMQVEYTREGKCAPYGNFGRYVFQSAFYHWKNQLKENNVDFNDLMDIAIKRIFDLGYDIKKHGWFDSQFNYYYNDEGNERIGKKYQWIAFYELLAQVSDKYPTISFDHYFDQGEILYCGPWQLNLRNFDPSILRNNNRIKNNVSILNNFYTYSEDSNNNNNWIKSIKDLPNPKNMIDITLNLNDDNFNGLILEGNYEWEEKLPFGEEKYSHPQKFIWCQIRSYIISKKDFNDIKNYLSHKNFNGRWMPESSDYSEVLNKEIYQSVPFEYIYTQGNDEKSSITINNKKYKLDVTTLKYTSLEEDSINDGLYLRINKQLFEKLNLSYGDSNSFLYSKNSEDIIGFDSIELDSLKNNLVFNKKILLDYLKENDLKIIFTVLGEKRFLKESLNSEIVSFSGLYYLNKNDEVKGKLNPFTRFYSDGFSIDFNGIVEEKEYNNSKYYLDKENEIIYYIFKDENLDNIFNFKNSEKITEKKFNNIKWEITYFSEIKAIGKEKLELNNISCKNGYKICTIFNNVKHCIIIMGNEKCTKSLNSKMFQEYIKPLLLNIEFNSNSNLNQFKISVDEIVMKK